MISFWRDLGQCMLVLSSTFYNVSHSSKGCSNIVQIGIDQNPAPAYILLKTAKIIMHVSFLFYSQVLLFTVCLFVCLFLNHFLLEAFIILFAADMMPDQDLYTV